MKFKKILALALALCMINSVVSPALADEFAGDIGTVEIIPDQPAEEIVDLCEDCGQEPCVCESVVEYCAECGEALTEGHVCAEEEPQEPEVPVVEKCECGLEKGHEGDCAQVEPVVEYCAECGEVLTEGHECAKEPVVEYCAECGEVLTEGHECAEEPVCICAHTGDEHMDFCPLYEEPEKNLDVIKLYEELMTYESDDEIIAFIESLNEDEYAELEAYVFEQEMTKSESIESVTFTEAGPFMPAVEVETAKIFRMFTISRMMSELSEEDERVDTEGLVTSKTAKANDDGTYTIRLESYVTGKTTQTEVTTSTPVDIVLVLDQSGSMAYDFNGDSTNTNTSRRQYAMKEAVNNFITAVSEKYNSEDADHRMSIVTFGSDASILEGWTYVNETGKATLTGRINGLPNSPSGATNVAAGMEEAEDLMGSGYSYTGTNTTRQKVVIVFTDGVPTTSSAFSTSVATNAIASAKNLKDTGATIYTIGIFTGVDPNQIYGSSNGNAGSSWEADSFLGMGDVDTADVAAGNRFLNFLSSNFLSASEIGLSRNETNLLIYRKIKYTITKNFDRDASDYYLTATDSDSLNSIFQTISENIQTGSASVQLGSSTVVQDIISDYFELPAGASEKDIKIYTSDYKADGTWATAVESNLTATINSNEVLITGFDYSKNYCDTENGRTEEDTTVSGDFYGRKLIIEFNIVPRSGFLGGNNVETNGDASGIYLDGTVVENFTQPTVNVPIADVSVSVKDLNVYYTGSLTADDMKDGVTSATSGGTDLYGNLTWEDDYVTITTSDPAEMSNLKEDAEYTVSITVAPEDTHSLNDMPAVEAKFGSATGKINVFTPVVTFEDGNVYYGGDMPTDYKPLHTGTTWEHDTVEYNADNMVGKEPGLTFMYDPVTGTVATQNDIAVNVTDVKIGDVSVPTAFEWESCEIGETKADGAEFQLHVHVPSLTVKDGDVYFGGSMPTADKYNANGNATYTWGTEPGDMLNSKPELSVTYSPVTGTVDTTEDIPVTATLTAGNESVDSKEFQLHVHVPTLTVEDGNVYYGGLMPTEEKYDASGNAVGAWGTVPEVMLNTAPALSVTYTSSKTAVDTKEDIPVTATLTAGTESVDSKSFNLHVYLPEFTFTDVSAYYGDAAPSGFTAPTPAWFRGDAAAENMLNAEPKFTMTFENEAGKVEDDYVVTDKAYKVNVASVTCANLGSVDLSNLTFKWEHDGCGLTKINEHTAADNSHEFYVHVNTCSLTITKTGMDTDIDPNEVVVFHVKGNNTKVEVELDVTIHGNDSVTINGLPVGNYSVTEDDKWSWRYTAGENNGAELSSDKPTDTVTVNNTRTNIYWLDFATWCQNIFKKNGEVVTIDDKKSN